MADLFPTDPKRIRERIRRYERALKRELFESSRRNNRVARPLLTGNALVR